MNYEFRKLDVKRCNNIRGVCVYYIIALHCTRDFVGVKFDFLQKIRHNNIDRQTVLPS